MEPFNAGWLSIVPPIVAIALALITKEVLSSLVLGILTGTLIYPEFADLFYAYGVLDSGRFIGESSHLVGLGSNQASFYLRA